MGRVLCRLLQAGARACASRLPDAVDVSTPQARAAFHTATASAGAFRNPARTAATTSCFARGALPQSGPSAGRYLAIRPPQLHRLAARSHSSASVAAAAPVFQHALVSSAAAQRSVGLWLAGGAVWVFSMVVLGGVTRLTRSGLSMTDWKFTGESRPSTQAEWEAEFSKYRASPEFQRVNSRMDLPEFQFIYLMEYAHRMWGRTLGLYFLLPLSYFLARGYVRAPLGRRLALLAAGGVSQGFVGWWMVRSGLEHDRFPKHGHEVPRVSPYRLAAHLSTAFAIYSGLLWTWLDVTRPAVASELSAAAAAAARAARGRAHPLAGLVALTALSGCFVAGMDAGRCFNTFPLMEGHLVPPEYWPQALAEARGEPALPLWRNALENPAAAQLHHRALALSTAATCGAFAWAYGGAAGGLAAGGQLVARALGGVALAQAGLGIAALLSAVPVWLGAAHQAGALTLFSVSLLTLHALRSPRKAAAVAARAVKAAEGKVAAAA